MTTLIKWGKFEIGQIFFQFFITCSLLVLPICLGGIKLKNDTI
jgi:hypothetical protein